MNLRQPAAFGFAIVTVCVLGSLSSIQSASVAGATIQGKLTNAANGVGIPNIFVSAITPTGASIAFGQTDAGGNYSLQDLAGGSYYIEASPFQTFMQQRYPNILCVPYCASQSGALVTVPAGGAVGGINMTLTAGGAISGTVTAQAGGAPIANIVVDVYSLSGLYVTSGFTNGTGAYIADRLPTGSYKVRTSEAGDEGYSDELFNNLPCFVPCVLDSAPSVVVTSGSTTSGINFSLSTGGGISGTVTDATTGLPNPNEVMVRLFTSTGVFVAQTFADGFSNGTYEFVGLPAGSYFVRTFQTYTSPYAASLYSNIPCAPHCVVTAGTPVPVVAGAVTNNINFSLQAGGTVSGMITDATTGSPIDGRVEIFTATGEFLTFSDFSGGGTYSVIGLPAGTYYARAVDSPDHAPKIYGGPNCLSRCNVLTGTPIAVTAGQVTGNINIALQAGGTIIGTVSRDGGDPLLNVRVLLYSSSGVQVAETSTDFVGEYFFENLPAGSYFARTSNFAGYIDELFNNTACVPLCENTITSGTPIVVTAGGVINNINFTLSPGGRIGGRVTRGAGGTGIADMTVKFYTSAGAVATTATTDPFGNYVSEGGLPAGSYYVRTFNTRGFLDEIFDDKTVCLPDCLVTAGTSVAVTLGATTGNVNFSLATGIELVQNGDFGAGLTHWSLFAQPNPSHLVWHIAEPPADQDVENPAFNYYRVPPPPNTAGSAVILQPTGHALAAKTTLLARFDVGNSSASRKRISVLIHEGNFSDLTVCTFWLEPHTPLTTYGMRTYNFNAWTNTTISFYAASGDSLGGYYELDNVSLFAADEPVPGSLQTDCLDPMVRPASNAPDGPELLVNGGFSTGDTSNWSLFGQITQQVSGGTFEFVRPTANPDPAGVILQPTGVVTAAGEILTAHFDLGNSSAVRKRVTVLLHDLDFSDLSACTFWIEPNQPLQSFAIRAFATETWTNTTISIYASSVGDQQWTRLDNVSLRKTPSAATAGAACIDPGNGSGAPAAVSATADLSASPLPSRSAVARPSIRGISVLPPLSERRWPRP